MPGGRGVGWIDPRGGLQREARAVSVRHIQERKGKVVGIGCQLSGCALADFGLGTHMRQGRGQVPQQRQLALPDDALSVIAVRTDDAADGSVVVRNGAVGEGVVSFLGVAVALHDEQLRFDVRSLVSAHGGVEHRSDIAPDFAPDLGGLAPERPGMFPTDDGLVRIVVEIEQLTTPANPDRLARGEHDPQGHAQVLRPSMRGSQRGRHPVEFTDELTEFSAARKEPNILNFLFFLGVLRQRNPCTAVIGRRSITGVMIIPRKS